MVTRWLARGLAVSLASLLCGAAGPPPRAADMPPGGEAMCAFVLISAAVVVGKRCLPGADPAFQLELEASMARLEAYGLRHKLLPAAELKAIRNGMDQYDVPKGEYCGAENLEYYRGLQQLGPAKLREKSTAIVSKAEPAPGDCL